MDVHFYCTQSGRSPVEEFVEKLPKADRARFLDVIVGLREMGLDCPRIQFKPLRGKLWEIKFRAPGGGFRCLYVLVGAEEMVLLHAFKKKTQKTPLKELELAERRMMEVLA